MANLPHSSEAALTHVPRTLLSRPAAMSAILLIVVFCACGESEVPPGVEAAIEVERGIQLIEDGHLEQAREAFGSAIAKDGQYAEAYARRGLREPCARRCPERNGRSGPRDRPRPRAGAVLQLQRCGIRYDGG